VELAGGKELSIRFIESVVLSLELVILPVNELVLFLCTLGSVGLFKYLVLHSLTRDSQPNDISLAVVRASLLNFKLRLERVILILEERPLLRNFVIFTA